MKNQKGFTMVELLAVILILGILALIAVGSVSQFLSHGEKKTYQTYEADLKIATENYLLEHPSLIPEKGAATQVRLNTLIDERYSEKLVDPKNKEKLCDGFVTVTNQSQSGSLNMDLEYEVCLICGKYQTSARCK